jgi:glycosyltransferase involved in cell wall biosynthesis
LSRIKVGIVTNLYPTRQHFEEGTFVKDLTHQLAQAGCNVEVIHYRRNFAAMFLETLVRRHQFDILDAQFLVPAGIAASLTPKISPFVTTIHRWDIVDFPYRWPSAAQWTKFVLRRADAVVAVSRYVARETARFSAEPNKIHVLPNAVDVSRFRPSSNTSEFRNMMGLSRETFLIFSVGRLALVKGYEYLLSAVAQVIQSKYEVALWIAGEGPRKAHLQSLSRSLGIVDNVRFLGRIEHDNPVLVELYRACDIFALTSMVEGHSIAITEAMACGKPIVCSRIPGNEDVVMHNTNGILVPPRDARGIASAIQTLCSSKDLMVKFGGNSREIACKRFSWSNRRRAIMELYMSLLRDFEKHDADRVGSNSIIDE